MRVENISKNIRNGGLKRLWNLENPSITVHWPSKSNSTRKSNLNDFSAKLLLEILVTHCNQNDIWGITMNSYQARRMDFNRCEFQFPAIGSKLIKLIQ